MKKIVYIDMDNTLADYSGKANELKIDEKAAKHIDGFFARLKPMAGAIEAYDILSRYFDVYILSTAPWSNPAAMVEKVNWVKKYLPMSYKNIIFSHHKDLNIGDYLIDDSKRNGASEFTGEHIQIWKPKFENWDKVLRYILEKENIAIDNINNSCSKKCKFPSTKN